MLDVHCRAFPSNEVPPGCPVVLVPDKPFDANLLMQRVKRGVLMLATLKNFRNMRQHNKFFALLGTAYQSQQAIQDRFRNSERFRAYIICRSGFADIYDAPSQVWDGAMFAWIAYRAHHVFFEELPQGDGVRVYMPKSMSLEKMPTADFLELYDRAMDVLTVEFGLNVDELGREPT